MQVMGDWRMRRLKSRDHDWGFGVRYDVYKDLHFDWRMFTVSLLRWHFVVERKKNK